MSYFAIFLHVFFFLLQCDLRAFKFALNFCQSALHSRLTPSTPAVPNCRCTKGPAPYWSNPPFLIPERQSARMSNIKNGGLDQYGAGPFEQQQFGTAGIEGVNYFHIISQYSTHMTRPCSDFCRVMAPYKLSYC